MAGVIEKKKNSGCSQERSLAWRKVKESDARDSFKEVKDKADLYLYAVPYSKENGKDYYVYGTGIKTSLSDLILGISNESLASAYIEYLTLGE